MKVAELEQFLMEFKTEVMSEIKEIKAAINGMEALNTRIVEIETKVDSRLKIIESKLDHLEGYSRRSNMIIHGLKEDEAESLESVEKQVREMVRDDLQIQEDVHFERIHRLGKKKANVTRPVIARFSFFKQKQAAMRNASKLKGKEVSISDDYTQTVRDKRRVLVPHMKHFRNAGKKVNFILDKLIVDGVTYTVNEKKEVVDVRSGEKLRYPEN